jgi:DNA-binding MarR family transcriptional regulator
MSSRQRPSWSQLQSEMINSPARAFGTVYRRFQEAANRAYSARGWKGLTLSHVQFLSETEETGTRLSDVASALKTTKQYAGRLAKGMASKRLVTLVADPLDGRAVLAKPTERGWAFLQDACEVRAELEARYLRRLSTRRVASFVATLKELAATSDS